MSLSVKVARVAGQGGRSGMVTEGDPGLFGGLFGAVKGGLGSLVTGGNPIAGAIRGGVSGFRGPQRPQAPSGIPVLPAPGLGAAAARALPFGRTGLMVPSSNGTIGCPSGHHPNKSDYFLRDGTFVPKGSRCVKNRRRNPLNPRALRRAVSRIDAGKSWQGKLREIETAKYTKAGNKRDSC